MKKKDGLSDYKLHYEELPNTPKAKRRKLEGDKKKPSKGIMDNHIFSGLAHLVPFAFQHKRFDRFAVLSTVDDRTPMPKMPQGKKAVRKSKAKGPL